MLRDCRDRGIVEIRVNGDMLSSSSLSRDLCAKFGLEDVYIARSRSPGKGKADRKETLEQVGRVAGMALINIVSAGDTVGVAWGETIKAMCTAVPRQPVEDVTVCQMIGSMVSDRVPASEDCTIRIANRLDAQCYTLHAPASLSSSTLAAQLRSEPMIASQLGRLQDLNLAVFSIGNTDHSTHIVSAGIASSAELDQAVCSGAKGIVCCRFIDAEGQHINLPSDERTVAITVAELAAAKKKMLVVAGEDRAEAVLAAIKGGLVTHLCVDEALAAAIVA
ncbi:sugar-binding domain-containing protein [uncultured Tateyamaria sp.]|uniref:sugar-binding transcriptional regulator n=1 Tax=uncultured Tateyamaria sp. TaxID=455651 RepID=UPI002601A7C4|nr:sugar-binding domain-containing protein [uncultured Tateyamaria sp.]